MHEAIVRSTAQSQSVLTSAIRRQASDGVRHTMALNSLSRPPTAKCAGS
jgi:hypothetical protein